MRESRQAGTADLPTARTAEAVLSDAYATPVTDVDVEWCGRRRLPPDGLDVVVYRGAVERASYDEYYVVLGQGLNRVLPAPEFDSVADLVAAVQAHRHDG
ncbi:MAG: hypothetical protein ABEH78_09805 [Haloferacaceae archaeon]